MGDWPCDLLLPLLFPLFWALLCAGIAMIGGWQGLAENYRATEPFEGRRWRFQSGSMRWGTGYRNCLTLGADRTGLFVSVLFLFRPGHPPLFVPWSDITVGSRELSSIRTCRMEFARTPGISLSFMTGIADKLRAEAGTSWPRERVEPT
jgi:hypothetical protein